MKFSPFIYLFIFIAAFVTVPCQADNLADGFFVYADNDIIVRIEVAVKTVEGEENGGFNDVHTHWIPNTSINRTSSSTGVPENFQFDALKSPNIQSATLAPRTTGGQYVIGGYFYVDSNDTVWGDVNNPDLYIKVWLDTSGRIDVNCFHVSVPDITCEASLFSRSANRIITESIAKGTATLKNRFVQLVLEPGAKGFVKRIP